MSLPLLLLLLHATVLCTTTATTTTTALPLTEAAMDELLILQAVARKPVEDAFREGTACTEDDRKHLAACEAIKADQSTEYTPVLRDADRAGPDIPTKVVPLRNWFTHDGPHGHHVCSVYPVLGSNLLSFIKAYDYNGLPLSLVRTIARHMLLAVHHMHTEAGVVHTDIKPENCLASVPLPPAPLGLAGDLRSESSEDDAAAAELNKHRILQCTFSGLCAHIGEPVNDESLLWSAATVVSMLAVAARPAALSAPNPPELPMAPIQPGGSIPAGSLQAVLPADTSMLFVPGHITPSARAAASVTVGLQVPRAVVEPAIRRLLPVPLSGMPDDWQADAVPAAIASDPYANLHMATSFTFALSPSGGIPAEALQAIQAHEEAAGDVQQDVKAASKAGKSKKDKKRAKKAAKAAVVAAKRKAAAHPGLEQLQQMLANAPVITLEQQQRVPQPTELVWATPVAQCTALPCPVPGTRTEVASWRLRAADLSTLHRGMEWLEQAVPGLAFLPVPSCAPLAAVGAASPPVPAVSAAANSSAAALPPPLPPAAGTGGLVPPSAPPAPVPAIPEAVVGTLRAAGAELDSPTAAGVPAEGEACPLATAWEAAAAAQWGLLGMWPVPRHQLWGHGDEHWAPLLAPAPTALPSELASAWQPLAEQVGMAAGTPKEHYAQLHSVLSPPCTTLAKSKLRPIVGRLLAASLCPAGGVHLLAAHAQHVRSQAAAIGSKCEHVVAAHESHVRTSAEDAMAWESAADKCEFITADLGNACWEDQHVTDDIQTRQYRAPEVLIEAPWDASVDMWSVACTIFELITGDFLFEPKPADDYSREEDHLAQIMELCGPYPMSLVRQGRISNSYFLPQGTPDGFAKLRHIPDNSMARWPLQSVLHEKYHVSQVEAACLADFLAGMLSLDPAMRVTAADSLQHPWMRVDVNHAEAIALWMAQQGSGTPVHPMYNLEDLARRSDVQGTSQQDVDSVGVPDDSAPELEDEVSNVVVGVSRPGAGSAMPVDGVVVSDAAAAAAAAAAASGVVRVKEFVLTPELAAARTERAAALGSLGVGVGTAAQRMQTLMGVAMSTPTEGDWSDSEHDALQIFADALAQGEDLPDLSMALAAMNMGAGGVPAGFDYEQSSDEPPSAQAVGASEYEPDDLPGPQSNSEATAMLQELLGHVGEHAHESTVQQLQHLIQCVRDAGIQQRFGAENSPEHAEGVAQH